MRRKGNQEMQTKSSIWGEQGESGGGKGKKKTDRERESGEGGKNPGTWGWKHRDRVKDLKRETLQRYVCKKAKEEV